MFRDDVVFLIFLYQRYIYRVDKTRHNEFGFAEEAAEGTAAPAAGTTTTAAAAAEGTAGASAEEDKVRGLLEIESD